ncbi:MAG TPA: hypothetical protein VI389_07815, partial [Geobacteraceae bacterium]
SLCLHYFPWHQTVDIVTEIGRCLRPGGILLARLNSVRDKNHGACGYPEVEPGLFLVGRELKRFFGREDVARLFSSGWKIHALDELTVAYHAVPKVLWEVVLERTSDDSLPSSKND